MELRRAGSSLRASATILLLLWCFGLVCVDSATFEDCISFTINSTAVLESTCTQSDRAWVCGSLQAALNSIRSLNLASQAPSESQNLTKECVSVFIPAGDDHYITAPMFIDRLSIHFIGISYTEDIRNRAGNNGTMLQLPSIICNYTVDVDVNRIFDLNYTYTDYLFYINQSAAVSIQNVQMVGCPYPIRINTADHVSIQNSLFRDFSEAVFDIYNCHNISISSSTFHDNEGTGISRYAFRGNTGAVAIGFNGAPMDYLEPQVLITNCNFTHNSATAAALFRSSSGAFFNRAFSGRGGAVGVFFNENLHNVTVLILNNLFQNNYARSFGGALFMVVFNEGIHHTIDVFRNEFLSNVGALGGGAIQMTFISNGIAGEPHTTHFVDSLFYNNSGPSGGAVYVYPAFQGGDGNYVVFERCHFLGNRGLPGMGVEFGAAIAISFTNFFRNRESLPRHEIIDCVFDKNYGTNGVVSIAYAPLSFLGNNSFVGNTGTSSVRIVGSLVELYGSMSFINNSVGDVAALHILSLGQIRLTSDLEIEFIGNKGRYGASILIETPVTILAFQLLTFNPQCFVLNETPTLPPSNWTDVSITFSKNEAVLASSIYVTNVDSCSWFSLKPPFFNTSSIKQWPIWNFGNDSRNTGFEDPYSFNYHVETEATEISSANETVKFWPGHRFNLDLTGWDQFNHPTFVSSRFYAQPVRNFSTNIVSINPALVITDSSKSSGGQLSSQYTLDYSVTDSSSLFYTDSPLATVRIDVPFNDLERIKTDTFTIYPMLCPVGYSLKERTVHRGMECQCREDVQQILTCEHDQDTILIQSGYWGAPYARENQYSEEINHFYPCPAGYCRCSQETSLGPTICVQTYKISQPDEQCACNRQGVLCGECKSGYGVSALRNNCVECNDAFALLIVILIILDAVVFVLIVLLDKPLPGWLYPFIFYLQIAPIVGQYFPSSFEIVGKFLIFIGSLLSFYFPYDFCLYGNMSPLVAYFLRYIPILVAMVMSPLLIIIRKTRVRVLDHYGLWWIILMLYTPVVHTSVSILHCPYIDTLQEYRWFVDGSVQCFTGWHVPLGLFALLMLSLCFAVIPITLIISLHKYPRKWFYWLRTISLPLKDSYKDDWKWWFSVELGRRLVFLILVVPLPLANAVPLLLVCILITLYGLVQPYKTLYTNILEVFVLTNFLFLLMLIKDTLFTFPVSDSVIQSNISTEVCSDGYSGIAYLTWVLFPFYYLPLVVVLIVGAVLTINYIRKRVRQRSQKDLEVSLGRVNSSYQAPNPNVRTVSVRIWRNRATSTGVAATRSHFMMQPLNTTEGIREETTSPVFSPTSSTVFFNANNVEVTD